MKATVRAGMAISLSGKYAYQATQSFQGLLLWVEAVNHAGGIYVARYGGKLPVTLRYYDDESRRENCLLLTKKLITEDNVDLLIGPYSSGLTRAASSIAEAHKKVLWNHGGSAPGRRSRYLVSIATPADDYFVGFLDLVRKRDPASARLGIVRKETGFSNAVVNGTRAHAKRNGFEVAVETTYPPKANGLSELVRQLNAARCELVLGVGSLHEDMRLAQALAKEGATAQACALVAAPMREFAKELGARANGFFGPSQWEAGANYNITFGPEGRDFLKTFANAYHYEPDYPAAQGYAIGLVMQRAIEEVGNLDDNQLLNAIRNLEFTTFYGAFKIDPATNTQSSHAVVLIQWQRGKKVIVWPKNQAQADCI